jgi:2-aminoethylphosphonate-pyruvate transaminase
MQLVASEGIARSVTLDLLAQWQGLEANGQFRFTPPTQVLLAFRQALRELEDEGGVASRAARYATNHTTLLAGMRRLGFHEYVPEDRQSHVITAFLYPDDSRFDFPDFYQRLSNAGCLVYPGKLTQVDCFRIGTIGRIFESDIELLLGAVETALLEMGVVARGRARPQSGGTTGATPP